MPYQLIAEASAPYLDYFRSLRGKGGHLAGGIFIAEGPKIVPLVLESKFDVVCAYMTPEWFARFEPLLVAHAALVDVTIATKESMEQVVGYALHQGLMLAVRIPNSPTIEEVSAGTETRTFVVLDAIADAENMGTIIRTCAAFSVTALIVDSQCCHPYLRRSVRVSMGTILLVPILRVPRLGPTLDHLRADGCEIVAAVLSPDAIPIEKVMLPKNTAIVFGAEGTGISETILRHCTSKVEIPISKRVDSLNVGVATGIILHERFRRLRELL